MHTEGFDRLWEAHLLKNFTFPEIGTLEPVIWFGVINIGSNIIQIIGTEIARRWLDTSSQLAVPRALFFINALLVASLVAFGLVGNFALVIVMYWSIRLFRSLDQTISTIWINQHVDSRVRATIFSMMGQADACGQAVGWSHLRSDWSYRISPRSHGRCWSTPVAGITNFYANNPQIQVSCSIARNLA